MKTLFSKKQFNKAKSRDLLPLQCHTCKKTFGKPKNVIQKYLSNNVSHVSNDFCSKKCQHKARITRQKIKCENCNKIFEKLLNQFKKSKHHFCCSSCAATYNNAHKTYGYNRSKIEFWIEKELKNLYPNLPVLYNDVKTISSELDIYIPSLSLAVEINGIFHYKPIYGLNKLSKIQIHDQAKFQKCIKNKIELCTIGISSLKRFKEQDAQKYLDIIISIIKSKL